MTNEELAIMIQNGNKSRIPELWERVRRIYMLKSFRYYSANKARCDSCGVTLEDVQQQSFFAFLESIEQYEPKCGLAFTSYIDYPFRTEMQELTRTRSSGQRHDCLNNCESLDKELDDGEGDGSTLHELVPDPAALDFLELLDAQSVGMMIRNEVQQLPERERIVITGVFFDCKTLGQIAEELGISFQYVGMLKKRGLVTLSKRRVLIDLWNEQHHTEQLRQLEHAANTSTPDAAFISRIIYEKRARGSMRAIDRAELHAEELREAAEASGEEWTREKKIAAIVEYLTQPEPQPIPV